MNEYRKALVIGLGYRTGLATSNFLASRGVEVTVTDTKSETELADIMAKLNRSVKVIAGSQEPAILDAGFDVVILSPGVPRKIPLVREAENRKIPVIAEIELAYRNMKGYTIGITGTDGKSTTTSLTGHIFSELGFHTLVGGNIGIPLISLADQTTDKTVTVIELSSYMLETIDTFKPDVAAILNVTPDHLDRYDGMDDYFAAKKRIFMNQTDEDWFIYNMDNEMLSSASAEYPKNTRSFSINNTDADAFMVENRIYFRMKGVDFPVIGRSELQILGIHNVQNVMASVLMVFALHEKMGIFPSPDRLAAACYSFKGLEHRMEFAGEFMGRTFVNDSKATTIGAVEMAVRSIKDKGILIIGGRTKGDDYTRLRDIVAEKARGIVLIGESSDMFAGIFSGMNYIKAGSMEDAVIKAMRMSGEGDMILLSPACASFDMFSSYDERGKVFKSCVNNLIKGDISWT